jgi:hypothetical protein
VIDVLDAAFVVSPEYAAPMECVPAISAFVVHVADALTPLPESATLAHP